MRDRRTIWIGEWKSYENVESGCGKVQRHQLILRIVIGLAVGVVLALAVPGAGWVEEFGSLFVGA